MLWGSRDVGVVIVYCGCVCTLCKLLCEIHHHRKSLIALRVIVKHQSNSTFLSSCCQRTLLTDQAERWHITTTHITTSLGWTKCLTR